MIRGIHSNFEKKKNRTIDSVFTLSDTETDKESDKNGLCRIVWKCSHCTERDVKIGIYANLSVSASLSVPMPVSV